MFAAPAAISSSIVRSAAGAVLLLLGGCEAPSEPSIARLARDRELGAAQAKRAEHRRELARLEQEAAVTAAAVMATKGESIRRAHELRAVLAELGNQVARLRDAERDLAAARERAAAVEEQIGPLREIERTLRDQDALRAAASERAASLEAEVRTLAAAADAKDAELAPRIAALRARLEAAQQVEGALAAANAAVVAALKVLEPPVVPPAAASQPAAK
ncbi:MAG: hypothetical protein JNK78_16170 [Planctomycetes bacterium]|nr:hypothetical protein [Planctomycetota bacterium]